MESFIKNIGLFIFTAILLIVLMVVATGLYTRATFDFDIDPDKNILVLGNSHPECAINDSILPNFFNLAQSGSAYFYDYIKLREVVKHNPQIDSVIIGYSYGDLKESMDKWITDEDKIDYKLRTHLFLMEPNDYLTLLKANPLHTLEYTPQTIFHNIQTKNKGFSYLGGFKPLKNHRLEKAKELLEPQDQEGMKKYSKYQTEYLLKIYEFCESKNIKLILLNTPTHPILQKNQETLKKNYCHFAHEKLPNALLINHASLDLPDSAYRDLAHLHSSGAEAYSIFLKANKFLSSSERCP